MFEISVMNSKDKRQRNREINDEYYWHCRMISKIPFTYRKDDNHKGICCKFTYYDHALRDKKNISRLSEITTPNTSFKGFELKTNVTCVK